MLKKMQYKILSAALLCMLCTSAWANEALDNDNVWNNEVPSDSVSAGEGSARVQDSPIHSPAGGKGENRSSCGLGAVAYRMHTTTAKPAESDPSHGLTLS